MAKVSKKAIMEAYSQNGGEIGDILNKMLDCVDPEKIEEFTGLGQELESRMFFADYLCEWHGKNFIMFSLLGWKPILSYDTFKKEVWEKAKDLVK